MSSGRGNRFSREQPPEAAQVNHTQTSNSAASQNPDPAVTVATAATLSTTTTGGGPGTQAGSSNSATLFMSPYGLMVHAGQELIEWTSNIPRAEMPDSTVIRACDEFYRRGRWPAEVLAALPGGKLSPDALLEWNGFPRSLLLCAVQAGRVELVEHLISKICVNPVFNKDTSPPGRQNFGEEVSLRVTQTTPLNEVIRLVAEKKIALEDGVRIISALLKGDRTKDKQINSIVDGFGRSPTDMLGQLGDDEEVFDRLAEAVFAVQTISGTSGGDLQRELLDMLNPESETPLDMSRFKDLLQQYPDLANVQIPLDSEGVTFTTLLYSAARGGRVDAAKILLDAGADRNMTIHSGNTALHVACHRGYVKLVDLLVRYKPKDAAAQTAEGLIAASLARGQTGPGSLSVLPPLNHTANVEILNSLGEKCYSIFNSDVSDEDRERILALTNTPFSQLIPTLKDFEANPSSSLAENEIIRVASAAPNRQLIDPTNDSDLTTLLVYAVRCNMENVVKLLLSPSIGADSNYGSIAGEAASPRSFSSTTASPPGSARVRNPTTSSTAGRIGGRELDAGSFDRAAFRSTSTESVDSFYMTSAGWVPQHPLVACFESPHKSTTIGRLLVQAGADVESCIEEASKRHDERRLQFFRGVRAPSDEVLLAFEAAYMLPGANLGDLKNYLNIHGGPSSLTAGSAADNPFDQGEKTLLGAAISSGNDLGVSCFLGLSAVSSGPLDINSIADHPSQQNALHLAIASDEKFSSADAHMSLCKQLVVKVTDLEAKDRAGNDALSLAVAFARKPCGNDDLRRIIQGELDSRAKLRAQKEFDDFCQSLPSRSAGGAPHYSYRPKPISPKNRTINVVLDAIVEACRLSARDSIHDLLRKAPSYRINPFLGEVIDNALEYFEQRARAELGSDLSRVLSLPVPQLTPFDVPALAQECVLEGAKKMLDTAPGLFIPCMDDALKKECKVGLASMTSASTDAVAESACAASSKCYTVFVATAQSVLDDELSKKAKDGRLFLNAFLQEMMPIQMREFENCSNLRALRGIGRAFSAATAASAKHSGVLSCLSIAYTDVRRFVLARTAEWRKNRDLAPLCAEIEKHEKKKCWWLAKCGLIDAEIIQGLGKMARLNCEKFVAAQGNSESKWQVSIFLVEIVEQEMKRAVNDFSKAPASALVDKTIVKAELIPSRARVEEYIAKRACLSLLLHRAQKELDTDYHTNKTTTNITKESFARVMNVTLPGIRKRVDGQTPGKVFNDFVRPLSHAYQWCGMSAFSVMDQVSEAHKDADVILLEAATGSGKTVLVPQWLLERCGCDIVTVTIPRRAPVQESGKYVAKMLGEKKVNYVVGGQKMNPNPQAPLQYVTDSFLLNRFLATESFCLARPPLQPGKNIAPSSGSSSSTTAGTGTTAVSAAIKQDSQTLVIDEAHERTAVMELLYMAACRNLEAQKNQSGSKRRAKKIVLASATLNPAAIQFYENTAALFGLSIKRVALPGGTSFTIKSEVYMDPANPAVPKYIQPSDKNRPNLAAEEAWKIVQEDPKKNKILCFLPDKSEMDKAEKHFRSISAGQIACAKLHAQVSNMGTLFNSTVLFSNQIAEASVTIKGLTHVLDFNMNMRASVDYDRNCHTLAKHYCTRASQVQRRGRVGRKAAGTYKSFGDLTKLEPSYPSSWELLTDDELLSYEIRVNWFLKGTLFEDSLTGLPTLGLGIPTRELADQVPKNPDDLALCAMLGLSGGMSTSFVYALKHKTCPRAILMISALAGNRVPLFESGSWDANDHVPSSGIGKEGGDYGAILHNYIEFAAIPATDSKKRVAWCKKKRFRQDFFENVEDRMASLEEWLASFRYQGAPSVTLPDNAKSWRWSEISDALMAGYWRNCAALVKNSLPATIDGRTPYLFRGPYHGLDTLQTSNLSLHRDSIYEQGATGGSLPDYVCFIDGLKRFDAEGRRFMKGVIPVDPQLIQKHSNKEELEHSLFIRPARTIALWCQQKLGHKNLNQIDTSPNAIYAETTVYRNSAAFSKLIDQKTQNRKSGDEIMELRVKADRVTLHQRLEEITDDINQALQLQFSASSPSKWAQDFGMPEADLGQLRKADPSIADRCQKATDPLRSDNSIRIALASGNKLETQLALMHIMVNEFGIVPKGGTVRDCIVLGKACNDLDSELRSSKIPATGTTLTASNMMSEFGRWQSHINSKYNIKTSGITTRKMRGTTGDDNAVCMHWNDEEIDIVLPWNKTYLPVNAMDFSCNNLCIERGYQGLRQLFPIMMTAMDIVRLTRQMQASPCRDCKWTLGGGRHGQGGDLGLESDGSGLPKDRIQKFEHKKGYKFVEYAAVPGKPLVLFHGCQDPTVPALILAGGFRPGTWGNLGPGVYMSRDARIVRSFATPTPTQSSVMRAIYQPSSGNQMKIEAKNPVTFPMGDAWQTGNVTAFLLTSDMSPRDREEFCITDYQKITQITQIPR